MRFKRHTEHFARGVEDERFLPFIGLRGWTLLTSDQRMGRRGLEREAIRAHQVRMFAFTSNNIGGSKMAEALKEALPKMKRFVQKNEPPFIASITQSGDVLMKLDADALGRSRFGPH